MLQTEHSTAAPRPLQFLVARLLGPNHAMLHEAHAGKGESRTSDSQMRHIEWFSAKAGLEA